MRKKVPARHPHQKEGNRSLSNSVKYPEKSVKFSCDVVNPPQRSRHKKPVLGGGQSRAHLRHFLLSAFPLQPPRTRTQGTETQILLIFQTKQLLE